jgi:peptidoglycan/xylan/chitin deacetylase (PgdA/CDA1 family)
VVTLSLAPHSFSSIAESRSVALTFDDLPAAGTEDPRDAESYNHLILDSLTKHHAPAIGFVNENQIAKLNGRQILNRWVSKGFDLGNHTFSHADLNNLSLVQFQQEVVNGEPSLSAALAAAGRRPRYLRFPINHTGDTASKQEGLANFLAQRGYKLAACTIENEDYLFNSAYLKMLAANDAASAERLRAAYLTYTAEEIDYYSNLNQQVFGRLVAHVMLFHLNRLNAELMQQLLDIFEARRYVFVTLDEAQSDPAYATPNTYSTKYAPMWGYRWAKERGITVNANLEPEPPAWISGYSGKSRR